MLISFTSEPKELPESSLNSLLRKGCICNVHRTWGPGVLWTWSCCWSWLFDGALVAEWKAGFAVVRAMQEWCSGVPVGTGGSDPPPGRHEGGPRGQWWWWAHTPPHPWQCSLAKLSWFLDHREQKASKAVNGLWR